MDDIRSAIAAGNAKFIAAFQRGDAVGKYIVVWKDDGGTWKLHLDIWNTNTPLA